jgi:hypothetical protein
VTPPGPRLRFPAATGYIINYLAPIFPGTPVSSRVPEGAGKFIKVLRTGGPEGFITDTAQITVECYATFEDDAEQLAMDTRSHLRALAGTTTNGVNVKRVVTYGGPANLPDPRTPTLHRYTYTLALDLRGYQEETQ